MAGNGMPQIEDSNDANKQKESVKKGAVTELRLLRAYSKNQRFIRSTAQIMQLMRSTAFGKKVGSHKLKNTGQSQSQIDRPCSAFHSR